MPGLKTHKRVAGNLARLMRLDPYYAEIGATLPDLDMVPPLKHRKTLHNLLAPFPLSIFISDKRATSILLGYLSHLAIDSVPKKLIPLHNLYAKLLTSLISKEQKKEKRR